MIRYSINRNLSLNIKIEERVSEEEMKNLTFNIEALVGSNRNMTIRFQLEEGLPIKWVKYVQRLCESLPNVYRIINEPRVSINKYSSKH